ncbi:hypothetical protein E0Z10_g6578 [Xylaria hypoxylon]|uniref:Uncharacterized protein n=1 Tax=Xylaria hypoxylon TaxID=37992 RepID=A0A4Z0YQ70_9PEZI|nr:hypothetical protein E0Z10_g6578 [Xylaria hypoxylon]
MSISTSSIAYFDRLPDEILLKILCDAMEHESPFFPEYCVQAANERRECRGPFHLSKLNARTAYFLSSQYIHLNNWLFVNTTSRRVRSLGREAFFGSKTIAMNSSLPGRLRSGAFSAFGNALDQELALRNIRSIVLVDLTMYISSVFLQLPKTLHAFPRLENSMILVGFRRQVPELLISEMERVHVPTELKQLLGSIGLASEMMPQIVLCKGIQWPELRIMLTMDVYPVLRAKADIMPETEQAKMETQLHVE